MVNFNLRTYVTIPNNMEGTGEHYAKSNKPGGERKILYDLTYLQNLIKKKRKIEPETWK